MAQVEISAKESKLLRALLSVEQIANQGRTVIAAKERAKTTAGLTGPTALGEYEAMFDNLHVKLVEAAKGEQ